MKIDILRQQGSDLARGGCSIALSGRQLAARSSVGCPNLCVARSRLIIVQRGPHTQAEQQ